MFLEELDDKFGKLYDTVIVQKFADAKKRETCCDFGGSADLRTKELKVELMEFPMSHVRKFTRKPKRRRD